GDPPFACAPRSGSPARSTGDCHPAMGVSVEASAFSAALHRNLLGGKARRPVARTLSRLTGGRRQRRQHKHIVGQVQPCQADMIKNEAETRYELIDPVLRKKGYRVPYIQLETPAPVEPIGP